MAFEKITEEDLEGKGVTGQPDIPGLSASEMQEKMEEIVRSVVIPAINNMIDEIVTTLATKEELARIVIQAGAVTSVFGRAGNVTAEAGDYTAAQVGAAPAQHKNQHKTNGSDPLSASDIGAAPAAHTHGNITKDGYIGDVNGKLLMTGLNGLITALTKAEAQVADRVHAHGNLASDGKIGSESGKVVMTGTGGAVEAKTIADAGIAAKTHAHGDLTSDGKVGTASGKVLMTGTGGAVEAKTIADAGIAAKAHTHGNITNDGKVGSVSGKLVMTGTSGAVEAIDKANSGLLLPPTENTGSTATTTLTLADNTEYVYTNLHALTLKAGSGNGETWGQMTFNSTANPTVTLSGFTNVAGDDYTEIAANETWEFSCKRKTLLWKKVSA